MNKIFFLCFLLVCFSCKRYKVRELRYQGIVVNSGGFPISGVTIKIRCLSYWGSSRMEETYCGATDTTDATGNFGMDVKYEGDEQTLHFEITSGTDTKHFEERSGTSQSDLRFVM